MSQEEYQVQSYGCRSGIGYRVMHVTFDESGVEISREPATDSEGRLLPGFEPRSYAEEVADRLRRGEI